jgi:hypothetical protein
LSRLAGVSCASSADCTAVGTYDNSAGVGVTLAEGWNGTSWQLQSAPNPAGATHSSLTEVSCTSSTDCIAVGSYRNPAGTVLTLAEGWNGTSWQLRSTPNPASAIDSHFNRVSCAPSTDCAAVGESREVPLAEGHG